MNAYDKTWDKFIWKIINSYAHVWNINQKATAAAAKIQNI
jgi:hypothetical protein